MKPCTGPGITETEKNTIQFIADGSAIPADLRSDGSAIQSGSKQTHFLNWLEKIIGFGIPKHYVI